jgi:hypothetical protein
VQQGAKSHLMFRVSFERELKPPRSGFLANPVNANTPRAAGGADGVAVETFEQALTRRYN